MLAAHSIIPALSSHQLIVLQFPCCTLTYNKYTHEMYQKLRKDGRYLAVNKDVFYQQTPK